jgi:hypothetical protein
MGAHTPRHVLERRRPFSQSALWDLQRRYFAERGVEAWRRGEVPHYVVSNPRVADSYAEIVFGFLRDRDRLAGASATEPLYVCELGAGSGRFAFHFLRRLAALCGQAGVATASFRYVLTDCVPANLEFWKRHPRFRPFFEAGMLDLALFDVGDSGEIALLGAARTLDAGSLAQPLVVIANYVFDSVPQELFHIDGGRSRQCLVSLAMDEDPGDLDAAQLLERVRCSYACRALETPVYQEPWLEELLDGYRRSLQDTYLLFPAAALRCLERLRALSGQGLLLLSADKGEHRLSALQGDEPPALIHHGSFSLSVNYHAIKEYCERSGGLAMFPDAQHHSVSVSACLIADRAADHLETRRAYARHVQDFSPDDFYTIATHARPSIGAMSVEEILAYLRLGHYDAHQFGRYLPRLMQLAPQLGRHQHRAVSDAVDRVWDLYFPLGEELDLADVMARLLYEMDDYGGALRYFERSTAIYGPHAGTAANMATCRQLLAQDAVPLPPS